MKNIDVIIPVEGTVFEIIANANALVDKGKNIFESPSGKRYVLTTFGFQPVNVWESEHISLRMEEMKENHKKEIYKLKGVLIESQIVADDLAHKLSAYENAPGDDSNESPYLFVHTSCGTVSELIHNYKDIKKASVRWKNRVSVIGEVLRSNVTPEQADKIMNEAKGVWLKKEKEKDL